MKIAVVTTYRPSDEVGSARVATELADNLAKNNKVLYICLGANTTKRRSHENKTYFNVESVFIKKGYIPLVSPRLTKKIFRALDDFSPDVIHSQGVFINEVISLVWAIKNQVPFVVTFHHLPSEVIGHLFPKLGAKKIGKRVEYTSSRFYTKRILKNVTRIIALNHYVANSVRKLDQEIPIEILQNGMNLKTFRALDPKKDQKIKVFTFVGSYTTRKNQQFLVETFSYLPHNYKLKLYGKINTGKDYVKTLRKTISKRNIKNVTINNFIKRRELATVLANTDYFVSASTKEAQSLVIVEALASSTPVIGLENETVSELINSTNGLVVPTRTSPSMFAKVVREYATNNKNYEKLSRQARRDSDKFQIEHVTKKVIKIYKNAIRTGPRVPAKGKKLSDYIPVRLRNFFSEVIPITTQKRPPFLGFVISVFVFITSIVGYPFKLIGKIRGFLKQFSL